MNDDVFDAQIPITRLRRWRSLLSGITVTNADQVLQEIEREILNAEDEEDVG